MNAREHMNGSCPRWVVYVMLGVLTAFGAGMSWLVAEHTRLDDRHVSMTEFDRLQADVREIRQDVKELLRRN